MKWNAPTTLPTPGADGEVLTAVGGVWTSEPAAEAPAATESTAGLVELATQGEVDAGVDDQRAVTPAKLAARGYALLASPAFTGTPTAPTQADGNSSTRLATTAFVATALTNYAPLASPALTGSPTAPTQASNDSSTKLATTAFVATVAAAAVATRKYAANVGDGVASAYTITHNLNTLDITVYTWEIATGMGPVGGYPTLLSANTILLEFISPPDPAQYRVVIHG